MFANDGTVKILDELHQDALSEILNIGMGTAASALSEMVSEEVTLTVPHIELLDRQNAAEAVGKKFTQSVAGVRQQFAGPFWGDALLLFPEEKSLELVCAVLRETIPPESLTEMAQEAMTEIGNVVLNACLCSLADMFDQQLTSAIPHFLEGNLDQIFGVQDDHSADQTVLLLKMEFSIDNKDIQGFVTFLMDIPSVNAFKENIQRFAGLD